MRAVLAWIFTLTAGFAAFMALVILALLPIQAARNRALYAVVDEYAHRLAATQKLPSNAQVDDAFAATIKGIRIWRSLPGGCHDTRFEASSDRFDLGFWENGSADRFGAIWWHCYAYPSGNTTLQVSIRDYLTGPAGQQVVAYALIAAIAAFAAWSLRSRGNRRSLKPWTKAIWFGALMTVITLITVVMDFGDDQFWENTEYVKWFVLVQNNTIGVFYEKLSFILDYLPTLEGNTFNRLVTLLVFGMWFTIGWTAGRLVSFARRRLSTAQAKVA